MMIVPKQPRRSCRAVRAGKTSPPSSLAESFVGEDSWLPVFNDQLSSSSHQGWDIDAICDAYVRQVLLLATWGRLSLVGLKVRLTVWFVCAFISRGTQWKRGHKICLKNPLQSIVRLGFVNASECYGWKQSFSKNSHLSALSFLVMRTSKHTNIRTYWEASLFK